MGDPPLDKPNVVAILVVGAYARKEPQAMNMAWISLTIFAKNNSRHPS